MKIKKHNLNTDKFSELLVFGILSQKKSHDLALKFSALLNQSWLKSNSEDYHAYYSVQEETYSFLLKNSPENLFSIYAVDYILIVANCPNNAQEFKNQFKKLQENSILLGFYELKLQTKIKSQTKELLETLLQ
jgi:hypothetical protein